jgi:hypothetical protein
MNKVFHYYCIRVLAQLAGFPANEAQTIAYASQYTDHASEHKKIRIDGMPMDFVHPERYQDGKLDPICTAHSARHWHAKAWKWALFYMDPKVQRKVLVSFHFLPGGDGEQWPALVTRRKCNLVTEIVRDALNCLGNAAAGTHDREYALVKLGLALHSYADSWAHEGFSGRHSDVENDIKDVRKRVRGTTRWKKGGVAGFFVSYAAPDIGHGEAMGTPDESHLEWRAQYSKRRNPLPNFNRDNTQHFLEAAETIHGLLSAVSPGTPVPWEGLRGRLESCFAQQANWRSTFYKDYKIEFYYDRFEWRETALAGDTVDWDDYDSEGDFADLHFSYTEADPRWFMFHRAAYEQREKVRAYLKERSLLDT